MESPEDEVALAVVFMVCGVVHSGIFMKFAGELFKLKPHELVESGVSARPPVTQGLVEEAMEA